MYRTTHRGPGTLSNWLAEHISAAGLVIIAGYGLVLLLFLDVTEVGPDQVRDIHVARAIAEGEYFPLFGPIFRGTFHFGPAYYYLSAVGYSLGGADGISALNLILSIAALMLCWGLLRKHAGTGTANAFAAFSLPGYLAIYAASPWSPALTFPLSCLALGLLVGIASGQTRLLRGAVPLMALLIQVHPSACLLFIPYAQLLRQPSRLRSADLGIGLALALPLLAPWIVGLVQHGPGSLIGPVTATEFESFRGLGYWDTFSGLATIGASSIASIGLSPTVATPAAWAFWVLLAASTAVAAWRWRLSRWVRLLLVPWLLMVATAVAALDWGMLWYLDVLCAGWVVLAALGAGMLTKALRIAVVALGVILTLLQVYPLRQQWSSAGWIDPGLTGISFSSPPNFEGVNWPMISRTTGKSYFAWLESAGLGTDQVAGEAAMALRELTARSADAHPRPGRRPRRLGHWLAWPHSEAPPRGKLVWQHGDFRLYESPVQVSGTVAVSVARQSAFETGFAPTAQIARPVSFTAAGAPGEVWAAFRCSEPVQEPLQQLALRRQGRPQQRISVDGWNLHFQYYYRIRWRADGEGRYRLQPQGPLPCDVTVTAF